MQCLLKEADEKLKKDMKKQLKKFTLQSVTEQGERLSNKALKAIMGGYDEKDDWHLWTDHGVGTCGFKACDSNGSCAYGCGMPMGEAQKYANGGLFVGYYGSYCCDSCGITSYCG